MLCEHVVTSFACLLRQNAALHPMPACHVGVHTWLLPQCEHALCLMLMFRDMPLENKVRSFDRL